jgi:hypothetical protein
MSLRHPEERRLRRVSKDGRGDLWQHPSRLAARGGKRLRMTGEIFSFINIKFSGFPGIVIPVSRTSLILLVSCPMRGRF